MGSISGLPSGTAVTEHVKPTGVSGGPRPFEAVGHLVAQCRWFSVAVGAIVAFSLGAWASAAATTSVEQRLAAEIVRAATTRTMAGTLTIESLDAAGLLIEEALQLDPNNADYWRLALDLGLAAEREALKARAIEQLARLEPRDDTIRLMRLNAAIDRFQTVEGRIAAYAKLLSPENINRAGPAVASRLAFDCALLHQRQGDIEKFTERLTQALTLDSSNRTAAAVAAGFFRMNVRDAVGEAELLINLMVADPTDIPTQVALAQLLLEHGAYAAADRMYRLAVNASVGAGGAPTNELLADQAVAQWAVGDQQGALQTLRKRQAEMDVVYRNMKQAEQKREGRQEMTMLELAKLTAPVDPTLATVAAVIHAGRKGPEAASALATVVNAYEGRVKALKELPTPPDATEFARLYLELAWVMLWVGHDADQAAQYISQAQQYQALTDMAMQRFDGWSALRRGDVNGAIERLGPIAADDVAARLGLAVAYLQQGRTKEAAAEFLAVNRAQPGTLIGIWAASQLTSLLGQRIPLSPEATKLERLIATIPPLFDRCPLDATQALRLRVTIPQPNVGPFEPIVFNIELTNTSTYPLALDREGPIRPQVLVAATLRSANAPKIGELQPFIVNVGRRLRLLPQETLIVPVNLRMYHPSEMLNMLAVNGAIVKLKVMINFAATFRGTVEATLLGSEVEAPLIRVDGERVNTQWIHDSLPLLQNPASPGVVERMALLSRPIAPRPPRGTPMEERQVIEAARTAFEEAYSRLDGASQAWLLAVMPAETGPGVEGLQKTLSIAKKSDHRLVKLAYLLFQSTGATDPMIDAARRGEDATLRRLAEIILADAERAKTRSPQAPAMTQPSRLPAAPDPVTPSEPAPSRP
jgi:tetratricopeptide (TPR) repeat protein